MKSPHRMCWALRARLRRQCIENCVVQIVAVIPAAIVCLQDVHLVLYPITGMRDSSVARRVLQIRHANA